VNKREGVKQKSKAKQRKKIKRIVDVNESLLQGFTTFIR
jgi:hypothetical protein